MNKKEAITTAALKLLVSKGIHATPMSAIAKEAGTGMGTIYNYFPNKEMLVNALYVEVKQAEKIIFRDFDKAKSIKSQFEKYYVTAVEFYINNPMFFNLMEQLEASPIITAESKAIGYEAITPVFRLIENGKKKKEIKKIDTNELIQFIGGTVISYLRLYFKNEASKNPSLKNQLTMVWDAIKR